MLFSTYDTDDKLRIDILIASHGSAQNYLAQRQIFTLSYNKWHAPIIALQAHNVANLPHSELLDHLFLEHDAIIQ